MSQKGLLNFQRGWPSTRLCAREQLSHAAQQVLAPTEDMANILLYGPGQGYAPLRASIAHWLSDVYARPPAGSDPSRLCVTNGASAALASVALKFADPTYTRRIFMIEPTYFLACPIFEDCGFTGKLRGIPEGGQDCVDFEFLLEELTKVESEDDWPDQPLTKTGAQYPHVYKYILYCTTTFMNPSAKTMPLEVRQELVKLAREFDILLVSDDVYDFLDWSPHDPSVNSTPDSLPPRLVDVDRALPGTTTYGNAISNGSFSKIIGPGIRVGWVEAQQQFASQLGSIGSTSSGGNPTHFASTIVAHTLRTGSLQKHIRSVVVPEYQKRYHALTAAFDEKLVPLGYEVDTSSRKSGLAGGFFTYLRLPHFFIAHRIFAKTVAAIALRDQNLRIAFGHMFCVAGDGESIARAERDDGFAYCMRLCWAWHEREELLEAVQRLADCTQAIRARIEAGEDVSTGIEIGIR